ncbi:hypothetical protein A2U01_0116561, partial [Trifolium medium]|nr:hypothetical protein [Trifolium medium]
VLSSDLSIGVPAGTTPPLVDVAAHDDRLLAIQSLLINRLDQWCRLWEPEFSPSFFHQET